MKNEKNVFDQVVALLNETIDVLLRAERAPDSPVNHVTTTEERRLYLRHAERLRNGQAEVVFKNMYNRKQLVQILENTVERDKIRVKTNDAFFRLGRKIGALMGEDPKEARRAFDWVFAETERLAKECGPDSEEAARWRQLQFIVKFAKMSKEDNRRRKKPSGPPAAHRPAHDPSMRAPMIPAEILDEAAPGEEIIPIPAEVDDAAPDRVLIRIGFGPSAWVGSFACGFRPTCFVFIMPDGKHLFVSAGGAGYIVDLASRTLVERIGTDVVGTHRDRLMTLFVVNHSGVSLEAFGVATRLWKTAPLGAGGLRKIAIRNSEVVGEARQRSGEWARFVVDASTGEVSYGSNP